MVVWSSVGIFGLSLLAAGPLRGLLPSWGGPGFDLLAVISLFVLICLLESGAATTRAE
jgi:hypothetical protein